MCSFTGHVFNLKYLFYSYKIKLEEEIFNETAK